MTLLPSRSPVDYEEPDPQVIGLSEDPDRIFSVLQSETARAILNELYEEPAVASELTDRVDTSLQNIQYHLKNLREADLVTVVDTWYSSRGKEMNVYAPTSGPLTLVIGQDESTTACRQALEQLSQTVPN